MPGNTGPGKPPKGGNRTGPKPSKPKPEKKDKD